MANSGNEDVFYFVYGEGSNRVTRKMKRVQISADRFASMFEVILILLLALVKIKGGFVSSLRSFCARELILARIRTQIRLTIPLRVFQIDVDGLHVVEEFGNLAEWPNRDRRFDLSAFARGPYLPVKGKKRSTWISEFCAACCFQSHGDFWEVGFF